MAHKPYDPTTKVLVEYSPADWPLLLGQAPGLTDVIDADVATVSGAADKALLVHAASPYLLHLEFQSGHDAVELPRKLHLRNTLLENRHLLPVHSAAILLRPEADSQVLSGTWERMVSGNPPNVIFRYQVVRVWQLPPEPLLRGGAGLLPLAVIADVPSEHVPAVLHTIETRLHTRPLRRYAEEVRSAAALLLGLRYSPVQLRELLRRIPEMKESSYYQMILEEGMAQGLAEGKAEGKAEGMQSGALAEARKLLLRIGKRQLGPASAQVRSTIEDIDNLEYLESLADKLLSVQSWQELLDLPKPRRRSRA